MKKIQKPGYSAPHNARRASENSSASPRSDRPRPAGAWAGMPWGVVCFLMYSTI